MGVLNETGAQQKGGSQVQRAAHADDKGQQAGGHQDVAVEQHMQRRKCFAMGDGQHGQAGALVVVLTVERQGPEVRGRPDKRNE